MCLVLNTNPVYDKCMQNNIIITTTTIIRLSI